MRVDNQELRREIAKHQQKIRDAAGARRKRAAAGLKVVHRQRGTKISERLGELILLLCANLAEHASWRGYSYRQDMIQAAAIDCMRACGKIDLARNTSCFSFLTTTAWRCFAKTVEFEHRRGFTWLAGERPELESMDGLTLGQFATSAPDARFHLEAP